MRTLAGPDASIAFTHLSHAASVSLSAVLAASPPSSDPSDPSSDSAPPTTAHAECHEQGVLSLMQARNIPLERVCLLDPKAPLALSPADGDIDGGNFAWFLFGVAYPLLLFSPVAYPFVWLFWFVRASSVRHEGGKKAWSRRRGRWLMVDACSFEDR
jgi:hypothetical protein